MMVTQFIYCPLTNLPYPKTMLYSLLAKNYFLIFDIETHQLKDPKTGTTLHLQSTQAEGLFQALQNQAKELGLSNQLYNDYLQNKSFHSSFELLELEQTPPGEACIMSLLNANVDGFAQLLQQHLQDTSYSYLHLTREDIYHVILITLMSAVSKRYGFKFKAEREHGDNGRCDLYLWSDQLKLGILLELKHHKKLSNISEYEKKLHETALEGLKQIQQKGYSTAFKEKNITEILQVGVCFSGKLVYAVSRIVAKEEHDKEINESELNMSPSTLSKSNLEKEAQRIKADEENRQSTSSLRNQSIPASKKKSATDDIEEMKLKKKSESKKHALPMIQQEQEMDSETTAVQTAKKLKIDLTATSPVKAASQIGMFSPTKSSTASPLKGSLVKPTQNKSFSKPPSEDIFKKTNSKSFKK